MNAQHSIYKHFISPEKEEAWLEQMSLNGWHLVRVSVWQRYTFEKGEPEKRAYKIDYRSFKNPGDQDDYLTLFKDSGWQPVMEKSVNFTFYFYTNLDGARRDIFSDDVSRALRNLRYAKLMVYSIVPSFLPLLVLYLTGVFKISEVGYLTPGLWEMQGAEFLFHFLFETPFVVMRTTVFFLPLIPLGLGLFFLLRHYLVYRKAAQQQAF